jgi:N-methylhydantoinase A
MTVGVDVGGTFTDVVAWTGGGLHTAKVSTTPDQSRGVLEGIAAVDAAESPLIHGTTAATNAVLQRAGARTALVTDAGFEDFIEIGRQDRPSLYDYSVTRPPPLVPRDRRLSLSGRATLDESGPIDPASLEELLDALGAVAPEAVAISLLFGFLHPERERAVADVVRSRFPEVAVAASSEVVPEVREFERASTTMLNAYLMPVVSGYLDRLAHDHAGPAPLVMRSSGGLATIDEAGRLPASIVLSGPAGGVVAASALGRAFGRRSLISFDMGGTSTDVCRIDDGEPAVAYERSVDGIPSLMPSVAIHTVGAGGGSIAWIDQGGALRVGPHSAGAHPGPVSYGRGGSDPAVTDADLVLGRIGGGAAMGTDLVLDAAAALRALSGLGQGLGLDAISAARGVVDVVEAHMERAVRKVSVDEGFDPRESTLVAFGGAGGLHAAPLARALGMESVLIPAHAGVFSALGLLLAPPRVDISRGVVLDGLEGLGGHVEQVVAEAERSLTGPGAEVAVRVDLRYIGQSHETTVVYHAGEDPAGLVERFHDAHERRNGFARRGDPVEVVAVRAEAVGRPALTWDELPPLEPTGEAVQADREVNTSDGPVVATVWWRPGLRPGGEILGPAVIEEPEATTYLGPGDRAVIHPDGTLEITW